MNEYVYNLEHLLEREHQTNLNLLRLIEIYEEIIDKAIEYIEYNNETYDISSYREDLLEILKEVKKTNDN